MAIKTGNGGADAALLIGSLLTGFLGRRKKAKNQKQVMEQNAAQEAAYRAAIADRQNKLDAANTDVANQTSQASERTRVTRNTLARAILDSLMPDTINKDKASEGLMGNAGFNPIRYSAPPPNVVQPVDRFEDPTIGSTYGAISDVLGGIGSYRAERAAADKVKSERERLLEELKLWRRQAPTDPNNSDDGQ